MRTVPQADNSLLRKLVNGDSVGEFVTNWGLKPIYLVYDEENLTAPRERSVFEQKEKIILMAKPRFLQASLDYESIYVTNDTYIARWNENPEYKPNIKYLLGLLNSKVLDLFYKIRHCEYVRGGWFVHYGFFFDELPIKKVDAAKEKEVVSIVNGLIKAKTEMVLDGRALTSITSMMDASNVPTTTAGLSKIVELQSRKGGSEIVEKLSMRGNTIYFNKQNTASIRCASENAARFVFELMEEILGDLKNRTLDDIMSSMRLPVDDAVLEKVESLVGKKRQSLKKSTKKIEKLRRQLDIKVAEIYGVEDRIDVIQNALKIIGGEIR